MREEWLKDIHDRMAGYETDEPFELWEDLCRAKRQEECRAVRRMKSAVLQWSKRIAAAAAMIALAVTVGHYMEDKKESPSASIAAEMLSERREAGKHSGPMPRKEDRAEGIGRLAAERYTAPLRPAKGRPADTVFITVKTPSPEESSHTENDKSKNTPDIPQQHRKRPFRQHTDREFRSIDLAKADIRRRVPGRLAFGIFTAGSTASSLNKSTAKRTLASCTGPDNSKWKDSPLLGMLVFNRGEEVESSIRHHLPVRAGVSFTYSINGLIGIESGMTYSRLTSDVKEGSSKHYFTGRQTLHYVGIPLKVKFRMLEWKGLELYASSGILAEKCVSGKVEKKYVLDMQTKQTETDKLKVKPLQWSVHASAGVQYNMTPSVGLYAEPGVSYYFDNGSPVKTVYKDKPFNFNFDLGIRFTLRKTNE